MNFMSTFQDAVHFDLQNAEGRRESSPRVHRRFLVCWSVVGRSQKRDAMPKRSAFIDDAAEDEDEGEHGEEDEDDEEHGNVEGLIADKKEKEMQGTHLRAAGIMRQAELDREQAELEAAEARYQQLGASYMQSGSGAGSSSRGRVHVLDADSEIGDLARAAADAEARRLAAEAKAAEAADKARRGAEAESRRRQQQALYDLYELEAADDEKAAAPAAAAPPSVASTAAAAAPPTEPKAAAPSGGRYRIKKKAKT